MSMLIMVVKMTGTVTTTPPVIVIVVIVAAVIIVLVVVAVINVMLNLSSIRSRCSLYCIISVSTPLLSKLQ